MNVNDLIDAVNDHVEVLMASGILGPDRLFYANWAAAETVDPNLSTIQLADGTQVRAVPKHAHVTGLVAGDLITGKVVGNPALFVS